MVRNVFRNVQLIRHIFYMENVNFFGKRNTRKLAFKVSHQTHSIKMKKILVKKGENVES